MTERFEAALTAARRQQRPLLMCAVVAGDPYLEATHEHLAVLAEAGADMVEVILPFSDPAYHGPVIQRACQRALREGVSVIELAAQCEEFRRLAPETPLVVSSYLNRLHAFGLEEAVGVLGQAGVDAILVTDLPWAEAGQLREALAGHGVGYVPALAPTTSLERAARIAQEADAGLAIWTGHVGGEVTRREALLAQLAEIDAQLGEVALVASLQISTPAEAAAVAAQCGGALVGSALVWLIEGKGADLSERLGGFVGQLRAALDSG